MPLAPGFRLGPYKILSPLGTGGMGEVYRARDEQLHRDVAIKVLPERTTGRDEAVGRFEREARAVATLSHPNIVAVHSFSSEGAIRYLVMELLKGETLQQRLRRGPLPTAVAVETAAQVADALAAAHEGGVVHRDVKPSNVFLTASGLVKVLDFGLASAADPGVSDAGGSDESPTEIRTRTGVTLGTVGYMAPEQIGGEVDSRTDIFSLGCVLQEMLTGESPFRRSSATATLAATLSDPAPPLGPGVPPELARVVSRCLEKSREARYHSARDLALDLRATGSAGAARRSRGPGISRARVALVAGLAAVALVGVGFLVERARARSATTAIASLAVLPFESASPRQETEYLVDGLTEGLINALSQLPDMRVVARTTAFSYKGKPLDLKRVQRELGVDAVLTGRMSERDDGFAVQADLIDLRTGAQLWGNRYRAPDTAGMEQTIASDVGRRLRSWMTPGQSARLDSRSTANSEAYRLYLEGRYEWNKRSRQRLGRARELFQQAVDLDPTFAQAYVGLADVFILMGGQFRMLPQAEALAKADAAARRALALDPGLSSAHASMGLIQANQFHFWSAEGELRAALELDPSYTMARLWYALVVKHTQGREQALAQLRQAQELDPRAPLVRSNIAQLLLVAGDHEAAMAAARSALDLDPTYSGALMGFGLAFESQGRYAEASEAYRRLEGASGPPNMARALLARLDAKRGHVDDARREARALEALWPSGEIAPTHIAWVYAGLRDNDKAFAWLERALVSRDVPLRDVCMGNLQCSELRDDPRYADLRRRMLSIESRAGRASTSSASTTR
jgi:serine/threonine-protein kinase